MSVASVIGILIVIGTIIISALNGAEINTILNRINSITNSNDLVGSSFGIIMTIIETTIFVLVVAFFWNKLDKKPIKDIGFINIKDGYIDLFKGLALGAILMSIVFILLLVSNNVSIENELFRPDLDFSLISGFIIFIFVGINEEVFCRGYCITVLKQKYSKNTVIIGSAIVFSLMHCFNDNMSVISYLNLFLFGILAAYMFEKTNNIWMCIGCHITWNYFQGSIFGFQVSGQHISSMYRISLSNNNIITGGNFGPEGGIVVTVILILSIIYMCKFYKSQKLENKKINQS